MKSKKFILLAIATVLLLLFLKSYNVKEYLYRANEYSSKWIVILSERFPTDSIKKLAEEDGWKIVVVADTNTPLNWSLSGVHFLSIERQLEISPFAEYLPYDSYTRKNIGYFYAIMNGAQYIFDTDDNVEPQGLGLRQFNVEEESLGLKYVNISDALEEKIFNPYSFYGGNNQYPKGYPEEFMQNHTIGHDRLVACAKMKTPAIQVGHIHKGQDANSRFQRSDAKTLSTNNNYYAAPILIDKGIYSLFNSKNTLFKYNAFLALLLPTSLTKEESQILRALYAQKMMHLVGERVGFYHATAELVKSSSNHSKDYRNEKDINKQTGELIKFLNDWECEETTTAECMISLAKDLADNSFMKYDDVVFIKIWIEELLKVGYRFPGLAEPNKSKSKQSQNAERSEICSRVFVDFRETTTNEKNEKGKHFSELLQWCNDPNLQPLPDLSPQEEISSKKDTILVLMRSTPWKGTIGLLQRLYGPYFSKTIFCGPWRSSDMSNDELDALDPVNYIHLSEEDLQQRTLYTNCMVKAKNLGIVNVKGYFFQSADTVSNFWNDVPLDVFYVQFGEKRRENMLARSVDGRWEAIKHFTSTFYSYLPTRIMITMADKLSLLSQKDTSLFAEFQLLELMQVLPYATGSYPAVEIDRSVALSQQYNSSVIAASGLMPTSLESERDKRIICDHIVPVFRKNLFHL